MSKKNDRIKRVIWDLYSKGYHIWQIARLVNVSEATVVRILKLG